MNFKMKNWKKYFFLLIFLFLFLFFTHNLLAEECRLITEEDLKRDPNEVAQLIRDIEKACQEKIEDLQGQQKTLASAISYLDNKIQLTTAQIAATEHKLKILAEEIADLSVKIDILDKSITEVSTILTSRIEATYKRERIKPIFLFFSSRGFSNFLSWLKYLKAIQLHDRQLLFKIQKSKLTFDSQKRLKEEKRAEQEELQKQLEIQKVVLARQKEEKAVLLEKTKNDEKKYQEMLAAARAEMEAIQSIIAGKGEETKVGDVKEGEKIASIIDGSSVCSTGTHLHFEVVKGGVHDNPAGYLKSISVIWDNAPDGEFSFSGSWNWPIDEPVRITQGYGMSYWAKLGWYGGGPHTGIDIVSESNNNVKAVKDGVLYRGSIACDGGTLRYVKVDHKDSDIDTYYLHVNYY